MKERLDVLLVEKGYAPSREKAKAIIMSGNVYVNGQKEDKAGTMFPENCPLEVRGSTLKYVSRGGLKLEKAMTVWELSLAGKTCMDIGASTGGFTDCMLANGAAKVYAVDVGHGQLAWKLRNDPRVVCMEQTNFRYMQRGDIQRIFLFETLLICGAALGAGLVLGLFLYQGLLVIFAGLLQPWLSPALLNEVTALGGLLVIGIGLNLLNLTQIRLTNMLPALPVVAGLAQIFL